MSPVASRLRASLPSDSVSTEITTSPLSLPTLVTQLAVLAAAPCSLLHIFFVESIFRIEPYIEVAAASRVGNLLQTSLTYTAKNHLNTIIKGVLVV